MNDDPPTEALPIAFERMRKVIYAQRLHRNATDAHLEATLEIEMCEGDDVCYVTLVSHHFAFVTDADVDALAMAIKSMLRNCAVAPHRAFLAPPS